MDILNDLRATLDRLYPTMYYIVGFHVQQGKVLRIAATDFYPEVWHMHPWDFAEQGALLSSYVRLVDFHNWKPTREDILRSRTIPWTTTT